MSQNKHLLSRFCVLLCIICILLPLMLLILWSFSQKWAWPNLLPSGLSLRAMKEVFGGYSGALHSLGLSILLSSIVAILATTVGTMTARALVFYDFPCKRLIHFSAMLPVIFAGTAFTMGLHVIFLRLGLSDTFLGVVIVHVLLSLPYTVKLMTDSTAAIGVTCEEAALTMGAGPLRAFWEVSIPALLPGLTASLCMGYIISFGQYFPTLLIGGGNVKTFAVMMVPYLQSGDRTIASAYSVVFIFVTLILFFVLDKAVKKLSSAV